MRGDLARILYERTRDDVEYVFGDSIAALAEDTEDGGDEDGDGEGVTVTFESGAVRRFDLVVGADGLHSNTRRLVFGEEDRFKRHLGAYISLFTAPDHLGLDRWETYHALPGKLVCVYSPAGEEDAKNLFLFSSPDELPHHHRDTAAQKRLLADAFAGDGWEIPGSSATRPAPTTSSSTRSPWSRWTAGRRGASSSSATPPTARRPPPGRAPAWP